MARVRVAQPSKPATIKDVARVAGVSFSTVSRVVNNSKPVDEPTRLRVLEAIDHLRYVPNTLARGLQTRQSRCLGIMLPEIGSSGAAQIVKGAEDRARQAGFTLLLMTTAADDRREVECLSTMRQQQIDGVIWVAASYTALHDQWLGHHAMPAVVIAQDFSTHGLPSVVVDNERAAFDATRHLIEQGHTRIAMITADLADHAVGQARRRGFELALSAHQLTLDPALVTSGDVSSHDSGYAAMERLLPLAPSAVLAASDILAIGAMQAILERGLSIPGDLSVMGFDDLDIAAHPALRLSTVALDFSELGQIAARTLIHSLSGEGSVPLVQTLPHRLVLRDTVRHL
ncbi:MULTISPECIES: LacI family DNA-binding transcriptional regulator [Deinococcus]|uniref:LacI family DNA-binding transcriptional regulator n=1 Tax=Deinococcus rufus TaxID=2136097 RepID=A0ABV7Z2E8_9DEIO|nr:LacI family DNA-binding transcriptional regulator [Deinococcus sp. AB2017081]WQE95840.1 LacI family DNA-binding transcriptional regulator [Deinococcus sp. AB2017081]